MKQIPLIFFLLNLFSHIEAQDLIFRSNCSDPVRAKIVTNQGPDRSYYQYDSNDSVIFHLLTLKIDSIIYQDGTKEVFNNSESPVPAFLTVAPVFKKNLAGIDAAALFYKNFRLTYEYFPINQHMGLKASLSFKSSPYKIDIWEGENIDKDESYYYRNFRGYSIWHGTLGGNYYFLPPGSFRAVTGLHFLSGSYYVSKIITDNNNNIVGTEDIKRPINGLLLSGYLFWTLNDFLDFEVGFDIPLIMRPPMRRAVLSAEFLLNF